MGKVIQPVNCCFKIAVDHETYRLADTAPKNDRTVANNVTKTAKLVMDHMVISYF